MMAGESVYLDTSGVIAFLDADDECHTSACAAWKHALPSPAGFVMTDYVRLECWSLLQRRLGVEAVEDFHRHILPRCEIHSVGEDGFSLLARQVFLSGERHMSMVDLSSFDCMRTLGLRRALAFDRHFLESGFITPEHADW